MGGAPEFIISGEWKFTGMGDSQDGVDQRQGRLRPWEDGVALEVPHGLGASVGSSRTQLDQGVYNSNNSSEKMWRSH